MSKHSFPRMTFKISVITVILISLSGSLYAAPKKTPAMSLKKELDLADQLFKERRDEKKARESLRLYRKLFDAHPKNSEIAWRLGMACYFVGIRLTKDNAEKEKIYTEGRDAALSGIKNSTVRKKRRRRVGWGNKRKGLPESDCAPCYFWTAINMALYGKTHGIFETLFSLKEIQNHLKDSIALDPKYLFGGAHRLLGQIEYSLPGILGGSNKRSKNHYKDAIKYGPDEPLNYLFFARLMNDAYDKPKEALEIVNKGLALPIPSDDRVESVDALVKLKELAKKLNTAQTKTN